MEEALDRGEGEQSLPELIEAQSALALSQVVVGNGQTSGNAEKKPVRARAPTVEMRFPDQGRDTELSDRDDGDKARKRLLLRHSFMVFLGPILFILLAAAGYLYWDRAKRFESTDDAFIAARQF